MAIPLRFLFGIIGTRSDIPVVDGSCVCFRGCFIWQGMKSTSSIHSGVMRSKVKVFEGRIPCHNKMP